MRVRRETRAFGASGGCGATCCAGVDEPPSRRPGEWIKEKKRVVDELVLAHAGVFHARPETTRFRHHKTRILPPRPSGRHAPFAFALASMAGKKKKSGGKKRGGDGGSTEEPDPFAAPEVGALTLENADRDLAIARLKTSTAAYRDAGDLLEAHVDALRDAVARERRDERDISDHLGRELIARQADVKRLYAEVEARETLLREEEARLDDVVASRVKACDAVTLELEARRAALVEREAEVKERRRERSRILEGLKTISQSISDDAASQRREAAAADAAARLDAAERRRANAAFAEETRRQLAALTSERLAETTRETVADHERKTRALVRTTKTTGRLLAAREAAAAHASRSGVDARVAEATLEAAERRAQALDAKTRELLRALDAIEERRRVERRARDENDEAYDEDAAALGASARGRPALLADLRRVERERDARRAEAARVRDAQETRREDPARFVSRALARYVFLKRDALVAEDDDDGDDDDESRRDPSADERAERVPSAASSASEGYGAGGRVVERDERSPSRVRRLGDLNRRRRLEAARFVLDELRATLETGADVYAFGGVGGEPPRPNSKPKPNSKPNSKPNAAAKRAAREAPTRDGDPATATTFTTRPASGAPVDAAPPPREIPNSTRGLVGMPMLAKAKDLPPIPSVAARWGARRPF